MEIKIATMADIDVCYDLILQARLFLKECGVDQWQHDYPNRDNIIADLQAGTGLLLMDGACAAAYACVDFDGEPAYDGLHGKWLDEKPYAVIHRLTVHNAFKGKGVAKLFFRQIETFVQQRGIDSIRIDTDDDNAIMKHLIESIGYVYCGTIWFDYSGKIAYQRQLGYVERQ